MIAWHLAVAHSTSAARLPGEFRGAGYACEDQRFARLCRAAARANG